MKIYLKSTGEELTLKSIHRNYAVAIDSQQLIHWLRYSEFTLTEKKFNRTVFTLKCVVVAETTHILYQFIHTLFH
jgi:hypothetical protein